ncbi:MAG: hypothetical protein QM820_47630 [Minicystis sp.]
MRVPQRGLPSKSSAKMQRPGLPEEASSTSPRRAPCWQWATSASPCPARAAMLTTLTGRVVKPSSAPPKESMGTSHTCLPVASYLVT